MTRHPNRKLPESSLEPLAKLAKVVAVVLCIFDVHENSHQIIAIYFSRVFPHPLNFLSLGRNRSKLDTKLNQCFGDQCIGDRPAIVKPKRQQKFEPPAGNAHTWLAPEF